MSPHSPIPRETPADRKRFDALCVRQPNGCLTRTGFTYGKGYAGFVIGGRNYRAHRVAYAWAYGDVETDIHHKCDNRKCVEPTHLVVPTDDVHHHRHRGPDPSVACAHGHEFTPENTYVNPRGERQCRTCLREAAARHKERNRERINSERRKQREKVVYEQRECEASDCDRLFTPARSTGSYCSSACYQRERLRRKRSNAVGD